MSHITASVLVGHARLVRAVRAIDCSYLRESTPAALRRSLTLSVRDGPPLLLLLLRRTRATLGTHHAVPM